jgi:competence protein ComEC
MARRAVRPRPAAILGVVALLAPVSCGRAPPPAPAAPPPPAEACRPGPPMTVTFYDAGQGLAALVELPDGRLVLVDTGESPTRVGCGAPCREWHRRVHEGVRRDVGDRRVDLLWITHPHSDHVGGAPRLLADVAVGAYVDNGTGADKPLVKEAREAADEAGTVRVVVDEGRRAIPWIQGGGTTLSPVVPERWPPSCRSNPNDCSIGLRIDYCRSSVLFTGDAEAELEAVLPSGPVTLLQVGHHGSETSSTEEFLARIRPRYAVVSSGKPGEGTNRTYCHPRKVTALRLTEALGGPGSATVRAFDGEVACRDAKETHWDATPVSDRLLFTATEGTVVLVTHGDGTFRRLHD